jgi:two-component system sensor histidine kinase UhpB
MTPLPSLRRRLLRRPLFDKILFANLAVVGLGASAGTIITIWHVRAFPNDLHLELIILFAIAGVILSYLVNRWVLRRALAPLDNLQTAVDRVRSGEVNVHVQMGEVSDERFDRLAETFNAMLLRQEENAAEMQGLTRRLIGAQEEERLRLARELHDEAAQSLTSLLVRLRLLEHAHTPEEAQARVHDLRALTASALEDVRRVSLDLRPTILDDLGLGPALEWRVDEFNKEGATQGQVTVRGVEARMPRETELALYRVGQEALSNVHRHAGATRVEVNLVRANGTVTLEVRDNGIGFDPTAVRGPATTTPVTRGCAMGLLGMRERMAIVGGELLVESAPGQGALIRAVVPVTQPAHVGQEHI